MNVRVVHEGAWRYPGGAERTAREIARSLDAPVTVGHTGDPDFWADVDASFPLQRVDRGLTGRLPRTVKEATLALAFRTLAFEEDVVVSSGSAAKWWVPRAEQVHVHYCHTPPPSLFVEGAGSVRSSLLKAAGGMADRFYADMATELVANSAFTADRVRTVYGGREARVIHPPVDVERFATDGDVEAEPLFVMIGRLDGMKRADVVAGAFDDLEAELVLVGDGPLRERCERVENVAVRPHLSDWELRDLVSRSAGGIAFARLEHCGITPKEFQAAGKPVVVPAEPNLENHVEDGVTGVVVEPTAAGVRRGVSRVLSQEWDRDALTSAAEAWGVDRFHAEIRELVGEYTSLGD